jgi:hypothetical protein
MDIGSILFITAILLLVAFYLAKPILEGSGRQLTATERKLSSLQARRDQVLISIHDLDLDRTMGKIEREDFETQRSALTAEGASILREIDALERELEIEPDVDLVESSTSKEASPSGPVPLSDQAQPLAHNLPIKDEEALLEAEIQAARTQLREPAPRFCSQCGSEVFPSDRFCSHCGDPLEQERSPA